MRASSKLVGRPENFDAITGGFEVQKSRSPAHGRRRLNNWVSTE